MLLSFDNQSEQAEDLAKAPESTQLINSETWQATNNAIHHVAALEMTAMAVCYCYHYLPDFVKTIYIVGTM